jgi:hypothetical protein
VHAEGLLLQRSACCCACSGYEQRASTVQSTAAYLITTVLASNFITKSEHCDLIFVTSPLSRLVLLSEYWYIPRQ